MRLLTHMNIISTGIYEGKSILMAILIAVFAGTCGVPVETALPTSTVPLILS